MENEVMAEETAGLEVNYEAAKADAVVKEAESASEPAHLSKLAALEAWVKGEFEKLKAEFTKVKSEL